MGRSPLGRAREREKRRLRFIKMIQANKAMSHATKKKAIDAYTGFED